MRTIQELLADKPEALARVEALIALHDVWVVGGAARALMYPLPSPSDIDLLLNREQSPGPLAHSPEMSVTGSGGQGQKVLLNDGTKLDVFDNGLTVWLHGAPCNGDGLAIRAKDNFTLMTHSFFLHDWATQSPHYNGAVRADYLERHQASLRRDSAIVFRAAQEDLRDETL